jgi:8-oxo-dGTP diphosphatase
MSTNQKFNIRVYGLLIVNGQLLVSDEFLWGKAITKLPGGGLEWGEGISDGLIREFNEELGITIKIEKLFYLNDFFQLSLVDKNHQIISIYYLVSTEKPDLIPVKDRAHDHPEAVHGSQVFRWIDLKSISASDFYFPIDKIVIEELNKLY